jgi:hypothetical protein
MNHEILDLLPENQQQIIRRAANLIKKHQREDFLKYTASILRGYRDPPSDVDVRHAAGAGICRYGKKL